MTQKKVPMRMCVACRQMRSKKELIRVVKTADGDGVQVDFTGKMPGRGAYLCRDAACLERAIKTKALERALEHRVAEDAFARLREAICSHEA